MVLILTLWDLQVSCTAYKNKLTPCRSTFRHLVGLCHPLSNTRRAILPGHLYWYDGDRSSYLTFPAVLLFITWVLRLDKYLIFIPTSVMLGFSVGVALIIGLNQIPFGFGLKGVPRQLCN